MSTDLGKETLTGQNTGNTPRETTNQISELAVNAVINVFK